MYKRFDKKGSIEEENQKKNSRKIASDLVEKPYLCEETRKRDKEIEEQFFEKSKNIKGPKIILNPYGYTPLSALILHYTQENTTAKVIVRGKEGSEDYSYLLNDKTQYHRIPIMGLYADYENAVQIDFYKEDGTKYCSIHETIITEPLPQVLEDAVRVKKHDAKMGERFLFVTGKSTPYPFAFDEQGEIRYVLTFRPRGYGLFPISGGHFIAIERSVLLPTYQVPHSTQMYEMDHLGRFFKEYFVPNGVHHDVIEMTPGGNLMLVTNSYDGCMEDVILEMDRNTGDIVRTVDGKKLFGKYYCDRANWVHINSLSYNPTDDMVIFNARNLHSTMKFKWSTCKVSWVLGNRKFWRRSKIRNKVLKTDEKFSYPFQAHSVVPLGGNRILMYDNHWAKRRKVDYFDYDEKSYGKIYRIDEQQRRVYLDKSFESVKSKITSNAHVNMRKKRFYVMSGYLEPLVEGRGGMIYEYDYDTERLLNQFSLKYFFYRTLMWKPNYDELATQVKSVPESPLGYLRKPKETKWNNHLVGTTDKYECTRQQQVIFVEANDHEIEEIWLLGKHNYKMDLKEPQNTQDTFLTMKYQIAMPVYGIESGKYDLVLRIGGEYFETTHVISIYHDNESK